VIKGEGFRLYFIPDIVRKEGQQKKGDFGEEDQQFGP